MEYNVWEVCGTNSSRFEMRYEKCHDRIEDNLEDNADCRPIPNVQFPQRWVWARIHTNLD